MENECERDDAAAVMRRINRAWLGGNIEDLAPMIHPQIVMVFPGFGGKAQGREQFLAGFRDFCRNATIHEFSEYDHQVDVAGDTAVVSFRYEMVYERSSEKGRSTGRDLWIFQKQGPGWVAVWRTMLDTQENPA